MFVSSKSPTRSIRTTPHDGRLLLLLGGEGHKTGTDSENERRFETLNEFLRRHFEAGPVEYRWATQDYYSVDRVPYVGSLTPRSEHVHVATGRSWDCPCHGSRFAVDGSVLQGPAVRDLTRFEFRKLQHVESRDSSGVAPDR